MKYLSINVAQKDKNCTLQTGKWECMSNAKQWSQQINMFCMTNRHLVTFTRKTNSENRCLGFSLVFREKMLPASFQREKTLTSLNSCLCWLLVSVSPVAKPLGRLCLYCSIRAWGVISVALSQYCWLEHSQSSLAYSVLITLSLYHSSRGHWP